jgi:hypothetical protein
MVACVLWGGIPLLAADHPASCPKDCEICEGKIAAGLNFLVKAQEPDGRWRSIDPKHPFGETIQDLSMTLTSLSCLALAARGAEPGEGVYGKALDRGIEALLRIDLAEKDKPYQNFQLGYWLTAVAALSDRGRGSEAVRLKVASILETLAEHQATPERVAKVDVNKEGKPQPFLVRAGGWSYFDLPEDGNDWAQLGNSVGASLPKAAPTATVLAGLAALRKTGWEVPPEMIEWAEGYLHFCQAGDGGFMYANSMAISSNTAIPQQRVSVPGTTGAALHPILVGRAPEVRGRFVSLTAGSPVEERGGRGEMRWEEDWSSVKQEDPDAWIGDGIRYLSGHLTDPFDAERYGRVKGTSKVWSGRDRRWYHNFRVFWIYHGGMTAHLQGGEVWKKWYETFREELLRTQGTEGAWEDKEIEAPLAAYPLARKVYATASFLTVWQLPMGHLEAYR